MVVGLRLSLNKGCNPFFVNAIEIPGQSAGVTRKDRGAVTIYCVVKKYVKQYLRAFRCHSSELTGRRLPCMQP